MVGKGGIGRPIVSAQHEQYWLPLLLWKWNGIHNGEQMDIGKVAVLGAGSWGTALASLVALNGLKTVIWARRKDLAESINALGENPEYLPGIPLPDGIHAVASLEAAVSGADVLVFVVPSHVTRSVAEDVNRIVQAGSARPRVVVTASKGIENETQLLMTDVIAQAFPQAEPLVSVLSGPSFAKEVMARQPTAVTVAAKSKGLCHLLQQVFSTDFFRVYSTMDLVGVQLGGAVKNVMAIAAGISDGMGFGTNTRAALITRGLAEMARLGTAMGANPLTLSGLAGLGDLVLTCTGDLSRNRQVGLRLGQGESIEDILTSMKQVAEGVKTSRSLHSLAVRAGIEMPITEHVFQVVHQGLSPRKAVQLLLRRPQKEELYGVDIAV